MHTCGPRQYGRTTDEEPAPQTTHASTAADQKGSHILRDTYRNENSQLPCTFYQESSKIFLVQVIIILFRYFERIMRRQAWTLPWEYYWDARHWTTVTIGNESARTVYDDSSCKS